MEPLNMITVKKKPQTSLKDLAEISGFSISTVSKALNNSNEISVRTKKRLKELARHLNYVPNRTACALRKRKTNTLMVFVPKNEMATYSNLLEGIVEESQIIGYWIVVHIFSKEDFIETFQGFDSKSNADGLLIFLPEKSEITHWIGENYFDIGLPILKYLGTKPKLRNKKKDWALGKEMCGVLIKNIETNIYTPATFSRA